MNSTMGKTNNNLSISKSYSPMMTTTTTTTTTNNNKQDEEENETSKHVNFSGQNLNASSKRLGARSFHNLLSLSCAQHRCHAGLLSPTPTHRSPFVVGVPLSQHMQYRELKQFKSTLECVEYLSRMHISESTNSANNNNNNNNNRRSDDANNNLSLRNLNPATNRLDGFNFNLEAIKKRLLLDLDDRARRVRDEYERQGARPKVRSSPSRKSQKYTWNKFLSSSKCSLQYNLI